MTTQDLVLMALTAWREARGDGFEAMQAVINVIVNRARHDNVSPYEECVRRLQFSSITAPGDPELGLWPAADDPQWKAANDLAQSAANGTLEDLTQGAVDYYNPQGIKTEATITLPSGQTIPFPQGWNPAAVKYTTRIGGHVFFRAA
jgi:N-acetylmuramoyl-L-alanine amidase